MEPPGKDQGIGAEDQWILTAQRLFRELQEAIYKVLPDENCLLKHMNSVATSMIVLINPALVKHGLISQQDICSVCSVEECPWHKKVSRKTLRRFKVWLLEKMFNPPLVKFFKKMSEAASQENGIGNKKSDG